MDLLGKIRELPARPGVYLYKDAEGKTIYVGKAKNLRSRVRSYFLAGRAIGDAKTGSLLREAVDIETIVLDNEREALALENNLIKQFKPRFNVLLRDDKTYPYIRLSRERYPRVYVTRRLKKDGSEYFGPYFPASLAYRMVNLVHRYFLVPSCTIDLTRTHPRPCLQYHIHRCLGPCVEGLTTPEEFAQAVQDARDFLAGRHGELIRKLKRRRDEAAAAERFEEAAAWRDLVTVVEDSEDRQKVAASEGEDCDVIGLYRDTGAGEAGDRAAVNVFHLRNGRMVDRREFFFEDLATRMETLVPEAEGTEQPEEAAAGEETEREAAQAWTVAGGSAQVSARGLEREHEERERSGGKGSQAKGMSERPDRRAGRGRSEEAEETRSRGEAAAGQGEAKPAAETQAVAEGRPAGAERESADAQLLATLVKQLYLGQQYVPRLILVPVGFAEREALAGALAAQSGHPVEIAAPQRGNKHATVELAQTNARHSFEQRFRAMKPGATAIAEALQEALNLPHAPRRIECFDISHFQGAETVASMVVWEDGRMKKSDYRKYIIRGVTGVDDFRSMEEVVTRRYRALGGATSAAAGAMPAKDRAGEHSGGTARELPSLILVDGGLGQLHAAQRALENLEIGVGSGDRLQPLASIAKREEVIYVAGQESEPVALDRHSPVLHLVQLIRDESHRFAITFHRQRRESGGLRSPLLEVPGVGPAAVRKLLRHFGSLTAVKAATLEQLQEVVNKRQAAALIEQMKAGR
jgi:excinuclease ABC subunit C